MSEGIPTGSIDPAHLMSHEEEASLTFAGIMEHLVDEVTGQEFLRLEPNTLYPTPDIEDMLDDMVLPVIYDVDGVRYLPLPEHYATLEDSVHQILAVAETSEADDPLEEAVALFAQLGDEFTHLVESDRKLPSNIDADHLLVLEDESWRVIMLLPPLVMQNIDMPQYTHLDMRTLLISQLFNSLYYRAQSKYEKDMLPQVLKGFTDAFEWGRPSDARLSEADELRYRAEEVS